MKNIFIIVLLIGFYSIKAQAQTTITDTSAYFNDSIMQKKNYYIGKPLILLLKDLRIEIVDNNEYGMLGYTDTFYTKISRLCFYYPLSKIVERVFFNHNIITPTLTITFQDTLAIPRHYFNRGGLLDYYKGWTRSKRNYWGQFIVADIRLSGVK
ncbi:MAG: hypothetical protein H3C56_04060 [Chitinophagaceae bacterium]|nr:hypothetical protein [Chitinophagaceae bacterium]